MGKKRVDNKNYNLSGKLLSFMFVIVTIIFMVVYLLNSDLVKKGDIVFFGSYEQDADFDNGSEPIRWKVISIIGSKAFLLSEYGLDAQKYNVQTENADLYITWENSSIRGWLNEYFYNRAFSDIEKGCILCTDIKNYDNPMTGTNGGNDTFDNVFLPSYKDVIGEEWDEEKYEEEFLKEKNKEWICIPTVYAKNMLVRMQKEEFSIWSINSEEKESKQKEYYMYPRPWFLRTPGNVDNSVMSVTENGNLRFTEDAAYSNIVRPMICVDLSSDYFNVRNEELKNQEHIPVSEKDLYEPEPTRIPVYTPLNSDYTMLSSLKQGDYLGFGSYEQDGNLENGSEIIEWLVLKNNNGTILLLSKDILDYRAYNDINQDILWPDSSIRNWLNNDFYDLAFDTYEKSVIIEHASVGDREPEYENDRYESKDKVFLLSYDDIINPTYGFDSKDYVTDFYRKSSYTDAVLLKHPDLMEEGNGNDEGIKECWWLRNRSRRTVVIDEETRWFQGTCTCNGYYSSGMNLEIESGIRPAIIIGESGK